MLIFPIYWIFFSSMFFIFIVSILIILRYQKSQKIKYMISNFDGYIAVLQYHMERAYDIIHKDQILIYSLEATSLSDEDFNNALKSFCRLTIKLIGNMIYKELIYLYGNEETILFNMSEYFTNKYDEDEIRTTSIDNLENNEGDIK